MGEKMVKYSNFLVKVYKKYKKTKEKKKRKSAQKIRIRQCALIYLFYKNST